MQNKELQEKIIKLEYIVNELIKFNMLLSQSFCWVGKDFQNLVSIYNDFNKKIENK